MDPAAVAVLTIGSDADYEPAGSLVEVGVTLFGLATTLDSYQFDVDFTPGVLSFSGADAGVVGNIDNVGGTVTGIARRNVGLNFGGTIVKLFFKASGPGTSSLSIPASSVSLLDSGGNKIPFTTKDGKVIVADPL